MSISWQLNVTGAGFRINYRRCSVINKIGDLIILVQNCFEFSFSRSRFSGTFYSYGKWHADRINIRYFFNLFVHDRFICRECSGQCNFRIFNRLIDHTGCSVERRIGRRLLDADHICIGRSPADGWPYGTQAGSHTLRQCQIGSYLCLTGIFTFDSIPGQLIGFRFHFGSKMFLIPSNDYSAFGCFCCRTV